MSERMLNVSINQRTVGTLVEGGGVWSFTYASEWLTAADAYPLGPGLPLQDLPLTDGSTLRPVQWYFDNLLPEEGQRTLLAKDARLDHADAFALLAYYGAESAGSLTLLAPDAVLVQDAAPRPLPDAALQQRIAELPRLPLSHHAAKRMSLAGAQHKLAVTLEHGDLFEPVGAAPSTHILKPDHPDADYPHSVVNETFTMQLAQRMGLNVPDVERRYVPAPIYLIRRFDRVNENSTWRRTHCIDACQLLNLDRSFKYVQGSMERLTELANLCRNKPLARVRLFEWLVFIALTGNGDAHLKNLSFSVSHEGIALAPHYDLLSTAVYETRAFNQDGWPDRAELAWPILGVKRFCEINRTLMLEAGRSLSLAQHTCERILDRQVSGILSESKALLHTMEQENLYFQTLYGQAPLSALAGEMRCVRAMIEVVIRDMVTRLG